MLSRTNWCVKNKKKKSDLSLVVIITYPSENAATIDRGCNQDGICASGHRKELSAFLLRCKRKHSWWVVNCYRQNTTTRSTCIFSRKASRAHCGPTLFLSLFPFFFFFRPLKRCSLVICSAAYVTRLGINRILTWVKFSVSNSRDVHRDERD